jgi:hypothetical protein
VTEVVEVYNYLVDVVPVEIQGPTVYLYKIEEVPVFLYRIEEVYVYRVDVVEVNFLIII